MTPNRVFFSRQDDDKLIDLIKSNPIMWDRSIKNFKNPSLKEKIWKEIGKKLDKKVSDCKTRWKTMRDYFKRQTRKKLSRTSSVSNINSRFQSLMFLHSAKERQAICNIVAECPEVKIEEDNSSITHSEEQNDSNEDDSVFNFQTHRMEDADVEQVIDSKSSEMNAKSTTNSSLKQEISYTDSKNPWEENLNWKRKIAERNKRTGNEGVDLFFESIISTVKAFPATHIAKAKLEILSIITKMELELLDKKSAPAVSMTSDRGTSP